MKRALPNQGNVGALFVIVLVIVLGVAFWYLYKNSEKTDINSFAECKAAGFPIQESYPEVCATDDGQSFPNPSQILE